MPDQDVPAPPPQDQNNRNSLRWHVLGGNNKNRVGGNSGLCVYEYKDDEGVPCKKSLLFDIGLLAGDKKLPEDPSLADSDTVIPDLDKFLYKLNDKSHHPANPISSIFLTHNHADHTGAIPFLILMGYQVPKIYATPYTAKRLEQDLSNAGLDPSEWPEIYSIAPGKAIEEGPVSVTAFSVSHSTPQSVGFFIETPEGNILTTGDFKMDQSVMWGPAFNEEQFHRIVSKPVDLLLLDSTGADRDVAPVTEGDVRETLREMIEESPRKRFIIAVMSGYEENLASVAKVAAEYGRTLWVTGSAHEQALSALQDTGMSLEDHIGAKLDLRILSSPKSGRDLEEMRPKDSIVVVTGATGQSNAALTRAADGHHNTLHLDPKTDIIVLCAPSIPGQEASRERMLATLRNKGFKVMTRQEAPLYSHAHARLPEIIDFVKMANPKCVIPIHGSGDLRNSCAEAMKKMGKHAVHADNGDVLCVSPEGVKSAEPPTKGKAALIGFKTLQGTTWDDRYYVVTHAPQENPPEIQSPANGNSKKPRPKIFDIKAK